ncbi:MAG: S1C family serine protease [Terriglobales bacterium]
MKNSLCTWASPLAVVVAVMILPPHSIGQANSVTIKIQAILVDDQLNQKPVPRLEVTLSPIPGGSPVKLQTGFDGKLEASLTPGQYRLDTPNGIRFGLDRYTWHLVLNVTDGASTISLSNDNATREEIQPQKPVESLAQKFRRLKNTVVTVWTDLGRGSGFMVDRRGLILTNSHVIMGAEYVAVQFDSTHKLAATVLATDEEKDVAILWADTSMFPGADIAQLAETGEEASLTEGMPVFSIGSPLNQTKILTSGIISKIEARAIISDVNINHGNSGGPLFDSEGHAIGVTTFLDSQKNGPGISGIVKIDEARGVIAEAVAKVDAAKVPPPSGQLLPVAPTDAFPLDALKAVIQQK